MFHNLTNAAKKSQVQRLPFVLKRSTCSINFQLGCKYDTFPKHSHSVNGTTRNYGNQTIEIVVQSITLLENGQVHSVQSLDRHGVQISHSSREEQGIVKNPMHPVPCSSRRMINDELGVHFQGAHQIRITSKDGRHIKYDNNVPTYVFRSKEGMILTQSQWEKS